MKATNLLQALDQRAQAVPDKTLFRFLEDGEGDSRTLNYGELVTRASSVAAHLKSTCKSGERVLLVFEPGLDFIVAFYGCLLARVIAVPAYPPLGRLEDALPKLVAIADNSAATTALTSANLWAMAQETIASTEGLARLRWVETSTLTSAGHLTTPSVAPGDVALLQYTSGSTGAPKGTALSHGNLVASSDMIRAAFDVKDGDAGVSWLPPYHDMGLIGHIVAPVWCGSESTLMSPLHFLQRPLRWLRAVSDYGATVSGAPNFAFDLCVRKATPQALEGVDLSRWRVAYNGADRIWNETLSRFAETFASYGFAPHALTPCYGLAEATLIVSSKVPKSSPRVASFGADAVEDLRGRTLVSTGPVVAPATVSIRAVDSDEVLPDGALGEVCVEGPCVALGYWNAATQSPAPFSPTHRLRTGDLGFIDASELFLVDRLKDILIVRGRKVPTSDVERAVESASDAVRPGCVASFMFEKDGAARVAIVAELSASTSPEGARSALLSVREKVVNAFGVNASDILLLPPGTLPKTSSGKMRRFRCRAHFLAGDWASLALA